MGDAPQYGMVLYDLDLNRIRSYDNVVADGFVPNTKVRWVALADKSRLEFSMDNYVVGFNKARQDIIDSQPKQS